MRIRNANSASDFSYIGIEHGKGYGLNSVGNEPIQVLPMMIVTKNKTENYAAISC